MTKTTQETPRHFAPITPPSERPRLFACYQPPLLHSPLRCSNCQLFPIKFHSHISLDEENSGVQWTHQIYLLLEPQRREGQSEEVEVEELSQTHWDFKSIIVTICNLFPWLDTSLYPLKIQSVSQSESGPPLQQLNSLSSLLCRCAKVC